MGIASSELARVPGAGLTKADLDRLKRRFTKLSQSSDQLSVSQFELMPELAGNPFIGRLFEMFDDNQDGRISLEQFNAAVESFLKLQNSDDKVQFVFRLYNKSGDGFVTDSELFAMLKKSVSKNISDTQLRVIVSNTINEFDRDGDGKLSLSEFKNLLSEQDIAANVLP